MQNKKIVSLLYATIGVAMLILAACGGKPQSTDNLARGGQLYDEWWAVLGKEAPAENQPLWAAQTSNTRSGGDTWRCKECHGWDYKGKDGAYGSGSHFTGFIGVMEMNGKKTKEIVAILKGSTNPDHDFSSVMDEQALTDLALFLNQGLIDDAAIVNDDKSPQASGNVEAGKTIFTLCTTCHGISGTAINFDTDSEPEYLGLIAVDNPWEFVHKVRFGQPGTLGVMPTGVSLDRKTQEYIDLLSYVQTLPTESPVTEGGRLYDKWWAAMGIAEPVGDHPLWATQTTNTHNGLDSWRCKECHGWDYKGKDGAYSSGSHFTGFPGVLEAQGMSAEELTAWLNGTKNPDHDFSAYMGEAQINMLVAFIQEGVADRSSYINVDKTVTGDAAHGEKFFSSTCVRCHGEDGKTINFGNEAEPEYIGTVANDNPWEAMHKGSFGQAGKPMPAGLNFGWSMQDIADLVAYLQTLPMK